MKKLTILFIALFFITSYSITAQNIPTATSESTKEVTKIECQDKDNTKTAKKLNGFNFKNNKKSSCSGSSKKSSCCTKKEVKKCGDSSTQECCMKSDNSSKICSNEKAMYRDAERKVRLAIANNEITAKEGYERLKLIKSKTNIPPPPVVMKKTSE